MVKITLFVLLACTLILNQATAQYDNTFGNNGIVITPDITSGVDYNDCAIQPDGKIVVAGNGVGYVKVVRYNADGTLDNSFGNSGIVITNLPGWYDDPSIHSVALLPNGKIIVGGRAEEWLNGYSGLILICYNSDGSLDLSFGSQGILLYTAGYFSVIMDIKVQPDGKIIAAGDVHYGGGFDVIVLRLYENGSFDTSFGTGGVASLYFNSYQEKMRSIALQSDGKIVLGGFLYVNGNDDFAIYRLDTVGNLDSTFGVNGRAINEIDTHADRIYGIALQDDGKIVAGGTTLNPTSQYNDIVLARYNTNGTIDSTYGTNGIVITQVQDSSNLVDLVIQPDNKIVAVGSTTMLPNQDNAIVIARYDTTGTPDPTFGMGGVAVTQINSQDQSLHAVLLQPDGKVVAAGITYNSNEGQDDGLVIRLIPHPALGVLDFSGTPNTLNVYPNPITESATLTYTLQQPETISIHLWDMNGRLVKTILEKSLQNEGEQEQLIVLSSSIPSGNYIITVSNQQQQVSVKIVK
jgi:uncharacterized delta-60 repeat protein